MNSAAIEWIGMIASVLTTMSWLPQAAKTIRTRQTQDISLAAQLLLFTGIGLWLVYGLYLGSWPLIWSNIVTMMLIGIILTIKLKNAKTDSQSR